MSVQPASPDGIPRARAGTITDHLLRRVIATAEAGRQGHLTDEGATLLLMVAAPALEELLHRRQVSGAAAHALTLENVHFLPGAR